MTAEATFLIPSEEAPHDPSKVRRDKRGRPYVKCPCPSVGTPDECNKGRIPGARGVNTKQCPKCKGVGQKEVIFSRCTSFVGVLDDRTSLEAWKLRVVLEGLAVDINERLVDRLMNLDLDQPLETLKPELNRLAEAAFEAGDGHEKARKGTDLHLLSEYVDRGEPLPEQLWNEDAQVWRPVTLQDRADMAAYTRIRDALGLEYDKRECFVVNDEYQIGGTYDGRAAFDVYSGTSGGHPCTRCALPVIVDLKTGRVDYGGGKMAQQLAVYAHSDDYDPATGVRTPQDVCQHVGIILHVPQGTGTSSAFTVDLVAGWEAVALSSQVRDYRRTATKMMQPLEVGA